MKSGVEDLKTQITDAEQAVKDLAGTIVQLEAKRSEVSIGVGATEDNWYMYMLIYLHQNILQFASMYACTRAHTHMHTQKKLHRTF